MWYNIDFNKWAVLLLPTQRRKPKFIAFVKTLVSPVVSLYDDFLRFKQRTEFYLNHNGQVCYMRKALNDEFDPILRRIQIGDGNQYQRRYIYTRGEQKPVYLGTMYLHSRDDYSDTGVDFIVYVPNDILQATRVEITAMVDYFKVAVKRYKLQEI